ncbi:serine hydrolase [Microbacterium pumilum]|uniref:Serine hydrolase n=1 Tax=Microbacterium pumilum TaxID=344165 RepID=A0ABP5D6C5_9MICO
MSARVSRTVLAIVLVTGASLALNGCIRTPDDPDRPDVESIAVQIEEDLDEFLRDGDDAGQVRAVLVYHDGEAVLERYRGADPEDYWDTRSVTKSVMSTLVGIAIGQGMISGVDATLGELLPSYTAEMTPEVSAITLQRLLTQTENFPLDRSADETFWESPDWIRAILAQRAAAGPGDGAFRYSNAGPHLLSAVLVEATGRSVLEFAREYLFEPLGIPADPTTEFVMDGDDELDGIAAYNAADFAWPMDPQGFHSGSTLLKLRPQDLAALGVAYLADGQSPRGDQVIPEDWVATATAQQVAGAEGELGYGYLWWTLEADGARAFAAFGLGGQLIEVVPERDLVVVVATEYDELDPERDLKSVSPRALTAMVSAWIAPRFAAD